MGQDFQAMADPPLVGFVGFISNLDQRLQIPAIVLPAGGLVFAYLAPQFEDIGQSFMLQVLLNFAASISMWLQSRSITTK